MTQGEGSKRRPENADAYRDNYDRVFKGPERIDTIVTRTVVPMLRKDKAIAQNDDPPYPRIIPRKELDDPYA